MAAQQATMNNMELTKAVHLISGQITELNGKLEKVIPEIYQKISDSESDISILFTSLKNEMQPYIHNIEPIHTEAQVQYQKLDNLATHVVSRIDAVSVEIEDKFLTIGSTIDDLQKAVQATQDSLTGASTTFGVEAQARTTMNSKIDTIGQALENLGMDLEHQKRVETNNYNQVQLQIATATSAVSEARQGPSGGARSTEPLATHK